MSIQDFVIITATDSVTFNSLINSQIALDYELYEDVSISSTSTGLSFCQAMIKMEYSSPDIAYMILIDSDLAALREAVILEINNNNCNLYYGTKVIDSPLGLIYAQALTKRNT